MLNGQALLTMMNHYQPLQYIHYCNHMDQLHHVLPTVKWVDILQLSAWTLLLRGCFHAARTVRICQGWTFDCPSWTIRHSLPRQSLQRQALFGHAAHQICIHFYPFHMIQHSSHEAFGQSTQRLVCGVQIASWLIPFPPRMNTPKMGPKPMDFKTTQPFGVDSSGERMMYVLNPCLTENMSFEEHGQRWHKPERGIGSRAGWKRLELHCNVYISAWMFDA